MATWPQDLLAFIIGSTSVTSLIGTRCHYNHIPENAASPKVWFRVTTDNEDMTMDRVGGLHEFNADLECIGLTEDSAQNVADAIKTRLHGYKGTVGASDAKAIFVEDKDDDYVPFNIPSDEGPHLVAYGLHGWYST